MKEFILKVLFKKETNKLINTIAMLKGDLDREKKKNEELRLENLKLKTASESEFFIEDIIYEKLGLPKMDLSNVDARGKPPHYLDGLAPEARKAFINELETIQSNEKFQKVWRYVVNLISCVSLVKEDVDQLRAGQMSLLGVRMVMREFDNAHVEFEQNKKHAEEDFDPLDPLPG